MVDRKGAADRQHDRIINDIESRSRRRVLNIQIPEADLRRAVRSLVSRAEGLMGRRDRDPILRAAADTEARHCRRIAETLSLLVREEVR